MRLLFALAVFGLLIFSPISHAIPNSTKNITEVPELSLKIAAASTAKGEFIYILIKNTGGQTGPYTLAMDYGDGMSDNKTFTKPITKNMAISQRFIHEYANGKYVIKAAISTPGELNTFNNAASKTINVKRNKPAIKNTAGSAVNSPTGKASDYGSFVVSDFFSKLMKMLG